MINMSLGYSGPDNKIYNKISIKFKNWRGQYFDIKIINLLRCSIGRYIYFFDQEIYFMCPDISIL